MLRRNPAGAIPVILKRLKQKDLEWRKARQQLNTQWKEVLVKNYDKSLDHRSFYFKQQDKHTYSARHLIAEVKVNPTDQPAPAGLKMAAVGVTESCPNEEIRDLCVASSVPQLYLTTKTKDQVVLMLVYRVICYAVEASSMSIIEKEKISAIWRDLLRVVFNMPVHYIYGGGAGAGAGAGAGIAQPPASPAPSPAVSDTESSDTTVPTTSSVPAPVVLSAMDAFAVGSRVLTQYGAGNVLSYNTTSGMHEVQLSFGVSYLPSSAIIGTESLAPSALAAIGVQAGATAGEDIILQSEKNGIKIQDYRDKVNGTAASSSNKSPNTSIIHDPNFIFYGTQMCYIFFRLHHTLMVRLAVANELSGIKQGEFRSRRRVDASVASNGADEDTAWVDPDDSDVEDLMEEDEEEEEDAGKEEGTGKAKDEKNENGKRNSSAGMSHPFTIDSAETLRKKKKKKYSKLISKRKSVLNTYLSQLYGLIDGSIDSTK